VSTADSEAVLYSFPDEESPTGVIRDSVGNLYGTTALGGAAGGRTVFKIDSTGKKTVLHSFRGGADGEYPSAGLIVTQESKGTRRQYRDNPHPNR
jgi:uncharacterized repeat protein (TIGR03803 family)